jgi:hypothetical protein
VDEFSACQLGYDALEQGWGNEHFTPDLGCGNTLASLFFGEG